MKKVLIVLGILGFIGALGLGFGFFALYQGWNAPLTVLDSEEQRVFTVSRGDGPGTIAGNLQEAGLVDRTWEFELLVRFRGVGGQLKAGRYALEPGMTLFSLVDDIARGQSLPEDVVVRIVEGLTVDEAALAFEESGLFSAVEFVEAAVMGPAFEDLPILADLQTGASLIGYLFPDTYRFLPGTPPDQAVRRILENTVRRFGSIGITGTNIQLGRMTNLHQVLTFASIVQKETPVGDEELIAGVFFNRLQNGWRFESDATVNFILGTSKLIPTGQDIRVNHPYNTYLITGLPPGPINSPGLSAISASLKPADHDFFFFLHTPDRVTMMSRTFEEHLEYRARYWE
ncbi:MAG: endolytic transglycosylase MltG [Spirochaetales bacterium]|nr:endolytic transglycosylase MltG [Spirochaetales bacterium]